MNLKKATVVAAIGLSLGLIARLAQWAAYNTSLFDWSNISWLMSGLWLFGDILVLVPLIIFLFVLNAKQKGK